MYIEMNSLREFGKFRLDVAKKLLWYQNESIDLPLKSIELLCVLTETNEVVTKENILNRVWQDSFIEESNLTSHVYRLRKMFAKYGESEEIIQTVPKRGYRFTGEIIQPSRLPEVLIEKQTITQTLIEEIDVPLEPPLKRLPPAPKQNRWWIPILLGLLLVSSALGYYFYARSQPEEIKSIAVLPLKSFDSRVKDENLSLRMMDSIITKLSKIESISVRPTSSTAKFLESQETAVEIGQKLVVDAILEGLIQKESNKIRVTIQLVSVKNAKQIWSEQFDGEADKLLDLQDMISGKLLSELNLRLTKEQETNFARRPTNNSDAYEEYLKGRYFWQKRTNESLKSAISSFEKAIKLDPNFADAYIGLADSYFLLFDGSYDTSPQNVALAKENISQALRVNPNLPGAYTTLGWIQASHEWNWKESEKSLRQAIKLNPNSPMAYHRLGTVLTRLRRFEEAESELRKAKELDPTSPSINSNLGVLLFFSKRYDEAVTQLSKAIEIEPNFSSPRWYLGRCYWAQGKTKESLDEVVKTLKIEGDYELANALESKINSKETKEVIKFWSQTWQKKISPTYINEHDIAIVESLIQNRAETLDWLEKSVMARHPWTTWANAEPEMDFVRDEPRFKALLKKMNFE